MKSIKVKDIINLTKGELITGNEDAECIDFSKDTRTIKKDDTYIGIKGQNSDGNIYWKEALEKGAKCVIVQDIKFKEEELKKYKDKVIIEVEDTLQALYKIAEFKRSLYKIPVIAITGSVGKTSTKDIIAKVVSQKYKTLKTEGNNNNNIGLPFTILRLKDEEAMVLEMGMNHFGEISLLSKIAKPDICVITNIGTSHIGNLGSRENILKAKLEILDGTKNPTIIINNDNDLLNKWYLENKDKYHIRVFAIKNQSSIDLKNLKIEKEWSAFEYLTNDKYVKVKVPVAGEHFVLNALSAILVAQELQIEDEKIRNGIETFELTKNRLETINLKNGAIIINDTYNASFESMQSSLKYISRFKEKRKIAVLGDMLELGEYSKTLHEKVGKEVYNDNIDLLICNGENSKYIVNQAKKSGMDEKKVLFFNEKEDIVKYLKNNITDNDIVLFKASNGMKFFDMVSKLQSMEY